MTVGEMIKLKRKEKGITQDELAKKLGISRPAVAQFEKETSHPRTETLQKIAEALGVPVYEFSFNEGERIKAIRKIKGVSQEELAQKLGVTKAQINEIEELAYRPSNDMILRLASALNVHYSDLVPCAIHEGLDEENATQKIDNASEGLKAIIQKLYRCDDITEDPFLDIDDKPGLHFIQNDHPYVFTDADFNDLIPLVDGLISAYVEQKKVAM